MRRWIWYWREAGRAMGWPGAAGTFVLISTIIFFCAGIVPLNQQLKVVTQQVEASSKIATGFPPTSNGQQGKNDLIRGELDEFYLGFRKETDAPEYVLALEKIALKEGLVLETGTYRDVSADEDRLVAVEVDLPINGGYVQIRQFINSVLVVVPFSTLDQIRLERANIHDTRVNAQLRFTIHYSKA